MQANRLPARRGAFWLAAGFHLFRRNPPLLTALTLTYLLLVQLGMRLLPSVSPFILPLALPVLTLIVANGARVIDRRAALTKSALLHGVTGNGVALLRLGGLHLLGAFSLVGVMLLLEGGGMSIGDIEKGDDPEVLWALLRLLVLATPLLMAFMFAPYLTGWDGVPPAKSVFFSFVACWRNWRAMAGYGLAIAVVAVAVPGVILVIGSLLSKFAGNVIYLVMRMLMVFVLAPVLAASLYVGYRDIFHGAPAPAPEPVPESAAESDE